MTEDGLVTIREAAVLVGRPISTINDWKRRGLIVPVGIRVPGRATVYDPEQVKAVAALMEANPISRKKRAAESQKEETLEEIEEMIAARSRPETLPRWWWSSGEKMKNGERDE